MSVSHSADNGQEQSAKENAALIAESPLTQHWDGEQRAHHANERKFWAAYVGLTLVAVIAAITSAIFAFRALQASQANVRATENSYALVQRAFVTVPELKAELTDGLVPGLPGQQGTPTKYWNFTPVFENTGNTLTKDLHIRPRAYLTSYPGPIALGSLQEIAMEAVPLPVPDSPPDPATERTQVPRQIKEHNFVIGPHSKISVGGIGILPGAFKPDSPKWFVDGIVTYNDIFPNTQPHLTKYCFVITGMPTIGEQKPGVSTCSHWNCTDDECETDKQNYETAVAEAAKPTQPPAR